VTSVIFGVRLDELRSVDQLRGVAIGFLDGDRVFRIFTPNPEILLHARQDPAYADLLRSADLALPDGTGVAIVQALRGGRSVRRWPGVEIAAMLLRLAAERGETVAFVGGSPDVAERAAARWRALPGLKVVVAGAGVAVDEDGIARSMARPEDGEDEAVDVIRSAAPTLVLVGLGAPKQERWIELHADAFPSVRIMIGVGGAFDMWAGSKRRAPRAFRSLGLEWLWRLALEPRRLPRTLRATVVFPVLALFDRAG
jgi:N-acetylglucosaminyldiphosphoundecaprenol N-acetyl-beta-D-mannosaminyltransferase